MSKLRFNDGVVIDTAGRLRVLRLRDGYYVIGEGMCLPVESRKEAVELIADIQDNRKEK